VETDGRENSGESHSRNGISRGERESDVEHLCRAIGAERGSWTIDGGKGSYAGRHKEYEQH